MNTLLIGLGSKARQGKDFVAQYWIEEYGQKYDLRRYGLADELKREAASLDIKALCEQYGIPYDTNPSFDDPFCPPPHGKQSRFLQHLGTNVRRAADSFYWVRKLRERIEQEQPQIAVIPDIRFLNEFYFVKAFGGFTVKVTRLGFVDPSRDSNHVSETELDNTKFDFEITCPDGELDELRRDAKEVFDLIIKQMDPEIPDLPYVTVQV